jgi:hypothetical protein
VGQQRTARDIQHGAGNRPGHDRGKQSARQVPVAGDNEIEHEQHRDGSRAGQEQDRKRAMDDIRGVGLVPMLELLCGQTHGRRAQTAAEQADHHPLYADGNRVAAHLGQVEIPGGEQKEGPAHESTQQIARQQGHDRPDGGQGMRETHEYGSRFRI